MDITCVCDNSRLISRSKSKTSNGSSGWSSKPYVMLSRLMYGDNLHVLGSWDSELFDLKPDPHMLQFIENVLNPLEINTIDGIPRLQSSILALEQTFHSLRRTRPQNWDNNIDHVLVTYTSRTVGMTIRFLFCNNKFIFILTLICHLVLNRIR